MTGLSRRLFSLALVVLVFSILACSLSLPGDLSGSGDGVTAIPLGTTSPAGGACENPLLPVAPTALWNYHVSGSPSGDFDYSTIIVGVNPDGFDEASHFGSVTKTISWRCTTEGLLDLQPGGGASADVESPNASAEFVTISSTGVTLPRNVSAGDTWTSMLTLHGEHVSATGAISTSDGTYTDHFTAVGMESIHVPAGDFSAMRIDIESNWNLTTVVSGASVPVHMNITSSAWYAPGVGLVQLISVVGDSTGTIVLTSYSLP